MKIKRKIELKINEIERKFYLKLLKIKKISI